MGFDAKVYEVLIASPSDVREERNIAKEVVLEWNMQNSKDLEVVLIPRMWEYDSFPALWGRAQSVINKQVVRDCDVLIGMFWSKLGTPTGLEESGTLEEIEEMKKENKDILLFFSKKSLSPDFVMNTDNYGEYMKVQQKKKEFYTKGIVGEYENSDEFRKILMDNLKLLVKFKKKNKNIRELFSQFIEEGVNYFNILTNITNKISNFNLEVNELNKIPSSDFKKYYMSLYELLKETNLDIEKDFINLKKYFVSMQNIIDDLGGSVNQNDFEKTIKNELMENIYKPVNAGKKAIKGIEDLIESLNLIHEEWEEIYSVKNKFQITLKTIINFIEKYKKMADEFSINRY